MNPCKVLALQNVTWKCNWKCMHCYFRRFGKSWDSGDTPLEVLKKEIDNGRARGCDKVALCGKGEPTLHSQVDEIIKYATKLGMKSLIISNGSVDMQRYQQLFDSGLDHVQLSMHGLGETLDNISGVKGAGKRQARFLEWANDNKHPFRVNITLQQLNYQEILDIAKEAIRFGAFHVSFLNFLPHYHWKHHVKEIAVDPELLIEPLEEAIEWLEKAGAFFTIRYFPMCMARPNFWKYITNARFVLFDPWEWEYGHYSNDVEKVWRAAIVTGRKVGIKGEPCNSCLLKEHCDGWNKFYARAFDFKGLKTIKEIPDEYKDIINKRGGLFDLNPANLLEGCAI